MISKIAAAVLLTLAGAAAHAETGWITIQGFYDANTGRDMRDYKVFGRFEGTDANADGVLKANEISYFRIGAVQYAAPTPDYPSRCNDSYHYCSLALDYQIGSGTADFKVSETWTDPEHIHYSRYSFETGGRYLVDYGSDDFYRTYLVWKDYTTMTITAVPEPSTVGMLLLGLAGTAVFARRRRG